MPDLVEVNGAPAEVADLALLTVNYGHFTYGQARGHAVRGLDLHLERLRRSTRELFGHALDTDRVRHHARGALRRSGGDGTLRIAVFTRDVAALTSGAPAAPEVLVVVRAPAEADFTPQRLRSVEYERLLPHIKHTGTMGLLHHGRRARQDGYDDALLTDRTGHVTEGAVANLLLHDGERFVHPESPHTAALPGIMRQLLDRGLEKLGVPAVARPVHLSELPCHRSAFLTNSVHPAQPVASVDDVVLGTDPAAGRLLLDAYDANPWDVV